MLWQLGLREFDLGYFVGGAAGLEPGSKENEERKGQAYPTRKLEFAGYNADNEGERLAEVSALAGIVDGVRVVSDE